MPRHFALDPKQRLEARKLRQDGSTLREIAEHFGISHNSVKRNLDAMGPLKRHQAIPKDTLLLIIKLKDNGFSTREIAELQGISTWCVSRAVRLRDEIFDETTVAPDFVPHSTAWDWDRTATEVDCALEW